MGQPQYIDNEVIQVTREGVWLSNGEQITHQASLDAYARNLKKDEQGYYVEIGNNKKRIEVEDTAFFVQRLEGNPSEGYEICLNDGTKVGLDPAALKYRPGRLSCTVMTRLGLEEAKFLRAPYFEMLSYLEEDERGYFLNFGGSRVELARK